MGLLDVVKKGQNGGAAGALFNPEYRKNVFRSDDQRMAAFYFSDENVATAKGCFGGQKKEEGKGCFKSNMPTVATRPYFDDSPKGCFKKKSSHYLSDAEFEALAKKIIDQENFKEKAMEALMLDASELETDPIRIGYFTDTEETKWKLGDDFRFRTSTWKETWLFFSKTSLLAYQCILNFDGNSRSEITYEYQYKDITSLKIVESVKESIDSKGQDLRKTCEFEIAVPGDKLSCSFENESEQINNVKAMKGMIRDKKNS